MNPKIKRSYKTKINDPDLNPYQAHLDRTCGGKHVWNLSDETEQCSHDPPSSIVIQTSYRKMHELKQKKWSHLMGISKSCFKVSND